MTKNPLIEYEVIKVAQEMIDLGARTRIVEDVTGLSAPRIRAIQRARHGHARKAGNVATSKRAHFATLESRLHTDVIHAIYEWVTAFNGARDAETLITACKLYRRICASLVIQPRFDVNGVYQIARFIRAGRHAIVSCVRCGCRSIAVPEPESPPEDTPPICPACDLTLTARRNAHERTPDQGCRPGSARRQPRLTGNGPGPGQRMADGAESS